MFCPVCGQMMRGSKSNSSYYDWGCCSICYIEFVEDREDRWKSGWRPSADEIERMITANRGG